MEERMVFGKEVIKHADYNQHRECQVRNLDFIEGPLFNKLQRITMQQVFTLYESSNKPSKSFLFLILGCSVWQPF